MNKSHQILVCWTFYIILIQILQNNSHYLSYVLQLVTFRQKFLIRKQIMYHRNCPSLANLRNSISKQIMEFQNIQLTHSRKCLPQSCKKMTSSSKTFQRIFNKSAIKPTNTLKNESTKRRYVQSPATKLFKGDLLHQKKTSHHKISSKLKKKGLIVSKPYIPIMQKSLASTKCVESKEFCCDNSCQHLKLNVKYQLQKIKYEAIIQKQKTLIQSLEGIIANMD